MMASMASKGAQLMTTFSLSFRVMGTDLDPDLVSQILGMEPSQSHKKGDPNIGKSGRRYSDFSEGLWALSLQSKEANNLEERLSTIVELLRDREKELKSLRELGYRMDIFVGVFGESTGNLGFSIDSNLLSALGKLGLTLDFDIYD
ncbi:MAG TPA: DUF4279 domain-containing protein [Thermoanaerobaculia bacterium]